MRSTNHACVIGLVLALAAGCGDNVRLGLVLETRVAKHTVAAGERVGARCALLDTLGEPALDDAGKPLTASTELRDRLEANTKSFRERMSAAGFEIKPGVHPIVPIMFSRFAPDDAPLAQRFARALLDEGIYVKGFFFPVVPKGLSRIRVQLSAAHRPEHIDRAVAAFTKIGKQLGVLA